MEKKSNMSNVDELCIKYVFDELDPSEISLVEQAMIADQNLLIEIESLKSTWHKLKILPEVSPPQNISDAIIHHAREYANQQQFFGNQWRNPGLMATAAIVVFSLLISTVYLLPEENPVSLPDGQSADFVKEGNLATEDILATEGNKNLKALESGFQTDTNHGFLKLIGGQNAFLLTGSEHEDGSNLEMETQKQADSLRTKIIVKPDVSANRPFILSPAFQDFQLTGTNY